MNKKKSRSKKEDNKTKRPFISYLLFVILFFALVFLYFRYVGTKGIKINEYNITESHIPDSFDGFSIVHFSDLDLGSTFNIEDLDNLVDKINKLNPNIIVFTGDIFSNKYSPSESDITKITEAFTKMNALLGKYSIRGDKDVSSTYYENIINDSYFKDITNSYELIYYKNLTPIVIYGLDSLTKGKQDFERTFSYPDDTTDMTYAASYRMLITHEPDTVDLIGEYNISLMMAGHSKNNEVNIPYIKQLYDIPGAKKYNDPEYNVNGTKLYISSGLGTSDLHMRFLSKPSISIYRLYKE